LAIDDLGLEPAEIMNYGNVITPAVELLSHRYNEQLMTIVTTNLDPSQIKQKYGVRIADRFREMFLKVIFKNGSYR
jgi:DNA replication protein DnaC